MKGEIQTAEKVSQEMVDSAKNIIINNCSDVDVEVKTLQSAIDGMQELITDVAHFWNTEGGNDRITDFNEIVQRLEISSQDLINLTNSLNNNDIPNISLDTTIIPKTESIIK